LDLNYEDIEVGVAFLRNEANLNAKKGRIPRNKKLTWAKRRRILSSQEKINRHSAKRSQFLICGGGGHDDRLGDKSGKPERAKREVGAKRLKGRGIMV
jgi:hypothetical protein